MVKLSFYSVLAPLTYWVYSSNRKWICLISKLTVYFQNKCRWKANMKHYSTGFEKKKLRKFVWVTSTCKDIARSFGGYYISSNKLSQTILINILILISWCYQSPWKLDIYSACLSLRKKKKINGEEKIFNLQIKSTFHVQALDTVALKQKLRYIMCQCVRVNVNVSVSVSECVCVYIY